MLFDPNSPGNSLPPLNDGYPDDCFVPPSAQDDSFPDDWFVPPSAQDDSFPDDWVGPIDAAAPSASPPAPTAAQPNANSGLPTWLAPPGSIAAYWSRIAADRQRTAPWAPPMFPDAPGGFPPTPLSSAPPGSIAAYWARIAADRQRTAPWAPPTFPDAPSGSSPSPFAPTPFNLAQNPPGLFGHPLKAPDWQQDSALGGPFGNTAGNPAAPPTPDFSTSLLFGGTGGLSSSFVSDQSDPSNVRAPPESLRRLPDASLPGALQGHFSGLARPAIGSINDPAYLVPVADKRKDPRNLDLFDERAFGTTPPIGSAAPRLVPPIPPNMGGAGSAKITAPYSRPSGATTPQQRASVQGQPCVDCGVVDPRMRANHIEPLVQQYYRTGTIDTTQMRSPDAVNAQCPTCSARQGGFMANFSKVMKDLLGF